MSNLKESPMLRDVVLVLATLAVVAIFAVSDPILRAVFALVGVFGGVLAFQSRRP